jgi:hypothetical protein
MPGRFAPHAGIPAKAVRAENDQAGEKETDRRDNKGDGEEAGATSILRGYHTSIFLSMMIT